MRLKLILAALASIIFSQASLSSPNVETNVMNKIKVQGRVDVIVYLGQRNSLRFPEILNSVLLSRTDRIDWVRDQLVNSADLLQAPLISLLETKQASFKTFYIENAILVRLADASLIEAIIDTPYVSEIRLDVESKLKLPDVQSSSIAAGTPGHISMIQVDRVWSELKVKGTGIVIAGQDTGYFWDHEALRNQYRGTTLAGVNHDYNWHDATDTRSETPMDDHSHGTHTMGTMVGFDGKEERIGVAPEAKWIGCRNMKKGVGKVSTYLECFEFFLAPYPVGGDPRTAGRPDLAPHIVNNSWACPPKEGCKGDEFLTVVRAMKAAGIFVVNAAGNEGPNCSTVAEAPAIYSGDLLTVGAYNRYLKDAASFSSRGPSAWNGGLAPNIVAPGDIIRSAVTGRRNKYDDKAGTSMSAPQVAGVVALLWSAYPELIGQIDRTTEILEKSSKPMTSSQSCGNLPGNKVPNAVFGYGMLDAYSALKLAE